MRNSMCVLLAFVSVICLMQSAAGAQDTDAKAAWLAKNAVHVRTIDPEDDDFADLRPLREVIGSARVVALGEQSHGDGATFLAKCRLVRFLHEEMGFDVLAWESGMFECRLMNGALRSGADARQAASRGIFPIFGESGHVLPVFVYARQTQETDRPLEMAGFDCQFSARGAGKVYLECVREFLDRIAPARGPDRANVEKVALEWLVARTEREKLEEEAAERAKYRTVIEELSNELGNRADHFGAYYGRREINFFRQTLGNLLAFEASQSQGRSDKNDPALTNLRDQRMGDNLAWLAKDYFAGRKIIVWAASFHLMRNAPTVIEPTGRLTYERTTPMGHVAHEQLKDDYYSIMFTAADGEAGSVFGKPYTLSPPEDGSLEANLAATKLPYAFVNLRRDAKRVEDDAWLADKELIARPLGYSNMKADWTNVFDGVFYTRTMFPTDRDGHVPTGVKTAQPRQVKRSPEQQAVSDVLRRMREDLITRALSMELMSNPDLVVGRDAKRLEAYPTPDAWPDVLGHLEKNPDAYGFVRGDLQGYQSGKEEVNAAFTEPLKAAISANGYRSLLFLKGVAADGAVTCNAYAGVACVGEMAGMLFFSSYATLWLDGDLTGQLTAHSYFVALITGKLRGKLILHNRALVYIDGGLDGGTMDLKGARVVLGGRATKADLGSIQGDGTVFVRESDLSPGEHKVGKLRVIVGDVPAPKP